jgi:outer membrane lipoprotein-sorting protein
MKSLRTTSTPRLLGLLAAAVIIVVGGAAIAVAATSSTSTPAPESLATSVHRALSAKPVKGFFADVSFTNNLIDSSDFTGGPQDPILQGTRNARIWISDAGQIRLELQSDNGDAQIVLNGNRFFVSDPASSTVYEGTLAPQKAEHSTGRASSRHGIPTVAQIQSDISRLMGRLDISGASTSNPTNVNGIPAYSVSISPKHSGGLLGSLGLAWDAATGAPLNIAVYARGNTTPVLQLQASNVSYGPQPASVFRISPPAGDKVVTVATPNSSSSAAHSRSRNAHRDVTGASAVAAKLPFALAAPTSVEGLPRETVKLLDWGGKPAALVTYGQGVGAVAVIEQSADKGASRSSGTSSSSSGSGSSNGAMGNLSMPTVTITGANHQALASAQELGTALGTVLRFTHGRVAYTVLGSVIPYVAEHAAATLLGNG